MGNSPKQKDARNKAAQDCISQKKNLEVPANLSELFLDTTDEYLLADCRHVNSRWYTLASSTGFKK
jgi:hypothetical protein